ncbi:amidohydrolase family protein [Leifsonia aquatica]|uniref:amidohydrolase family protein n=1 Tax=Leifsonia aquatica TaxID=144185 RepID=UPI00046AD643|nr:amidohydrolase family protein [Leifsonia aquatica]
MTAPGRIDAHHHFWDPADFDYPWMAGEALDPIRRPFAPVDIAPELATNAIDGTVLVQTVADLRETTRFLDLAAGTAFIRGVVGWVDLTDGAAGQTIADLRQRAPGTLVGIRHQVHDEPDADWLDRDDVQAGIRTVGNAGLAYDLLVRTRELPAAIRLVSGFADQRFVLDHIAKPPILSGWSDEWARLIGDLARRPNVAVKLSGMITEASWDEWSPDSLRPYVDHVLHAFGTERVLFGSDWPVCLLAASRYGEVVDAVETLLGGLSDTERADAFGGNAVRWYQLADVAA